MGAEVLTTREVTKARVEGPYRFITLSDGAGLGCRALVIATGVSVRQLNVPGIEALNGARVYYGAALTETASYRDQHIFVAGRASSSSPGRI